MRSLEYKRLERSRPSQYKYFINHLKYNQMEIRSLRCLRAGELNSVTAFSSNIFREMCPTRTQTLRKELSPASYRERGIVQAPPLQGYEWL